MKKRTFSLLIGIFLFSPLSPLSAGSSNADCISAIKSSFESQDPHAARDFFNLQASLTTHRLAWTYLNSLSQKSTSDSSPLPPIEKQIEETLNQIQKKNQDPRFKKISNEFTEKPLSRKALSQTLEALREALKTQSNESNSKSDFLLHLEDLKMLSLLSEVEENTSPSSLLWSENLKDKRSVLNILKLINSSYSGKHVGDLEREKSTTSHAIKNLENRLQVYELRVEEILAKTPSCQGIQVCETCSKKEDSPEKSSTELDLLIQALASDLKENSYEGVRYGEIWLRTARKAAKASPSTPTPSATPSISTHYIFDIVAATSTQNQKEEAYFLDGHEVFVIQNVLKTAEKLKNCISYIAPEFKTADGLATVKAAAAMEAEVEHHRVGGMMKKAFQSSSGLYQNFVSPPGFEKSCPELKNQTKNEATLSLHLLGWVQYFHSLSDSALKKCAGFTEAEKFLYSTFVKSKILNEDDFTDCKPPKDTGLATLRKIMNAIHF